MAGWYWTAKSLNARADALDYAGITKAINGGMAHHERRLEYYRRALEVCGRDAVLTSAAAVT